MAHSVVYYWQSGIGIRDKQETHVLHFLSFSNFFILYVYVLSTIPLTTCQGKFGRVRGFKKKVGVLPIRIVKSNVSSVDPL